MSRRLCSNLNLLRYKINIQRTLHEPQTWFKPEFAPVQNKDTTNTSLAVDFSVSLCLVLTSRTAKTADWADSVGQSLTAVCVAEPTRHSWHAYREKAGDSYVYSALFTVDRWRPHLDWNGFVGISLNTKMFSFRRFGEGGWGGIAVWHFLVNGGMKEGRGFSF